MPHLYAEAFQESQVLAGQVLIGKEKVELVGLPLPQIERVRGRDPQTRSEKEKPSW